jgi:hypothetical protein
MKLENFNLGEKLEKKQLEKIVWGGNTISNGHHTQTAGDDCDSSSGDTDSGGSTELSFQ